jgi:very-short-patch-repair endonuclease
MAKDYKAEFLAQLRLAGLPAPQAEVRFHDVRRWRFDFAYPESKLAIEYQGGVYAQGKSGHSTVGGMERDCLKFSTAASMGWRVMPINAGMVRSGEALQLVEAALKGVNDVQ